MSFLTTQEGCKHFQNAPSSVSVSDREGEERVSETKEIREMKII
tara:strand:+ start:321 stop:452 length:132 start_codon:yes stop_codon:yes gene_type:complete